MEEIFTRLTEDGDVFTWDEPASAGKAWIGLTASTDPEDKMEGQTLLSVHLPGHVVMVGITTTGVQRLIDQLGEALAYYSESE